MPAVSKKQQRFFGYLLSNPDESDEIEASKEPDSMHEVMYQIAIKNGGSWIGGSENASRL